jgi:hypothetical protein
MSNISTRLLFGFGAGALSHLIFQGGLGAAYYAAGLIPAPIWSLQPVPPYGVPVTVNLAFWAGLWGILYGLLEPRLTARLGRVGGGLAIGVAALLARWFVVLPLKGAEVAEGLEPTAVGIFVGFHLIFGLGLALIYGAALDLTRRGTSAPPRSQRG